MKTLQKWRFSLQNEKKLQDQIQICLEESKIPYKREFILSPKDRIDFLATPALGIEVKINKAANSLILQAGRYLQHKKIQEIILVTIRPIYLPEEILGKKVHNISIWNQLDVF